MHKMCFFFYIAAFNGLREVQKRKAIELQTGKKKLDIIFS